MYAFTYNQQSDELGNTLISYGKEMCVGMCQGWKCGESKYVQLNLFGVRFEGKQLWELQTRWSKVDDVYVWMSSQVQKHDWWNPINVLQERENLLCRCGRYKFPRWSPNILSHVWRKFEVSYIEAIARLANKRMERWWCQCLRPRKSRNIIKGPKKREEDVVKHGWPINFKTK